MLRLASELLNHLNRRTTHRGVYYFGSFEAARAYAQEHAHPADRIIRYERGWAIQLYVSGPYVGTDTPNLPIDLAHARYLRELERIRNAAKQEARHA